MSAVTARPASAGAAGVSVTGVLRSELLKLVTVRSTFWTTAVSLLIAAVAAAGIGLLVHPQSGTRADDIAASGATVGLSFIALVVGVLGVLAIGGEYATLQIRSSYTAVPRRWPALLAKGAVVGAWSFVLGLVATFGGFAVIAGCFAAQGVAPGITGADVGTLVGGALYLAVIGAFAVGLGALVRSSAAGITVLTALLFVAPITLNLIAALTNAAWASTASQYLLSQAGGVLFASAGGGGIALWAAWLALVCWLLAAWVPALLLTLRRDV